MFVFESATSVPQPTAAVPVRLHSTSGLFKVQPISIDTLYSTLLRMKPSSATGVTGETVDCVSVSMMQNIFLVCVMLYSISLKGPVHL